MLLGMVYVVVLIAFIALTDMFAFRMDNEAESLLYVQEAESAPKVPEVNKSTKVDDKSEKEDKKQDKEKSSEKSSEKKSKESPKKSLEKKSLEKKVSKESPKNDDFDFDDIDFADIENDFIVSHEEKSVSSAQKEAIKSNRANRSNTSSVAPKKEDAHTESSNGGGILGGLSNNSLPKKSKNISMSEVESVADEFFDALMKEGLDD